MLIYLTLGSNTYLGIAVVSNKKRLPLLGYLMRSHLPLVKVNHGLDNTAG